MEFIKQNIFLIAIAAISGAMLLAEFLRGQSGSGLSSVDATLSINRDNAIVVDLRDAAEFATGHLPGARNIPVAELENRLGELSRFKAKPVILVCQSGARSAKAIATLTKAGFERAESLGGGIAGWQKDGYPLVKDKA